MGQFIETGADHNASLNGLADGDGHTQYAKLAGRSGGQTLNGGTATGNALTLKSNTLGDGKIFFGSGSAFNEDSRRWGLGTDSPSHKVNIVDDNNQAALQVFNDGNNADRVGIDIVCGEDTPSSNPSATFVRLYEGDGGLTGQITADAAGAVTYNDVSDAGQKTDIAPTQVDGLAVCMAIPLVEYRRRKVTPGQGGPPREHKYAKNPIGWLAQDCQSAFPSMVSVSEGGMLMTDRSMLIPVLVRAIQQQQAQIADLTAQIQAITPPRGPLNR